MKLNKILMALSAMAIVGCSSEDFDDPSVAQAIDDSRLIQLDENFVLAGVGADGTTTRTHWELSGKSLVNKFLPIWAQDGTQGQYIYKFADNTAAQPNANLEAQAVGLCWLGNGGVGTDVYTNYEFYHFGWLNNGAKEAIVECDTLTNGSLYNEIKLATAVQANKEAVPGTDWTVAGLKLKSKTDDGKDNLNYNSGVYKTDNKAIFGGQYIVYYPFNPNFKDRGTIPATAETNWVNVPDSLTDPVLGHATFRYSAPVTIEGGDQAADFGLKNLSTLVQLRVAAAKGYTKNSTTPTKFDQIVLYSAKEQLLKQANLAADKIAAGATELYAATEGTKTITAKFVNAVDLEATDAKNQATGKSLVKSAYITVLPTKVEDLVVLVHGIFGTEGKWAQVSLPNTVFEAGAAKRLDITVADADFKANFIAVDDASLQTALNEARTAVGNINNNPKPQTITVIGDITINNVSNIAQAADEFITITGDDIIVPESKTLTLNTNMESKVRVLGKSCCTAATTKGGQLIVQGGTISDVTMEETEDKKPTDAKNPKLTFETNAATVAAGKTIDVQAGNVEVDAAVAHKGDIVIAKDAKLTVNAGGDLNFMGSNVTNNGTIEVKKNGKYDMTDANGNATATDGQRMTNNGKFIHNVDAGVGTAVQSMKQNGEYRCKVDDQIKLDDAFLQWTACSVIEMVNTDNKDYNLGTAAGITPAAYKHNGKFIDIEVNAGTAATTFSNPAPTPDNKEINIGKLTVKSPFAIDYTNKVGTTTGKRTLTVNGDMVVTANTSIRDSKKINIKQNLTLTGAFIDFAGGKVNEDGLAVTGDITVSGEKGNFSADAVDALNITCANFYLEKKAKAVFGNRTEGDAKNLVVSGTISNPATCTFDIKPAAGGNVLAWVTCKKLEVGGNWTGARPRVVE